MVKNLILSALLLTAMASSATGAAAPASTAGGLDRIIAARTLVVAITPGAPWVIRDKTGKLTGYDIDLVDALAGDLGVTPRYVEVPFPQLIDKVASGTVDMAVSGLAITPARALRVTFSNPTGPSVVRTVGAGKPGSRISAGGAGTTIAVLAGSTDEAAARAFYPKASFLTFPDSNAVISSLIDGRAQAMVATSPVPRLATHMFDGLLRMVGPPLTKTAEAIALRPDDTRLQSYLNNWIAARTADGFLANLREQWFDRFDWINGMAAQPAPKPAT